MELSSREFEELVVEALDALPTEFLAALANIDVVIESEPTAEHLSSVGLRSGTLLGLYEGVPHTVRDSSYGMVPPDKITIFQGPISRSAAARNEVGAMVRETVIHEIAHHFGISDARLRVLRQADEA